MEDFVQEFQNKHRGIRVDPRKSLDHSMDEDDQDAVETTTYHVTAIPKLDGLTLWLEHENDFKRLDTIVESNTPLFKDLLGWNVGGKIEVVLSEVTRNAARFLPRWPADLQPIQVTIGYESETLSVEIFLFHQQSTEIGFLASKMLGIQPQDRRAIARISGLLSRDLVKLEADTRQVLRSILFDIECSYGIVLEPTNLENLKPRTKSTPEPRPMLPKEQVALVYKPYSPELIEYFHTGERVDYLPFKFICYFHIIEYFMDKSAHSVVAKKIRQIIISPDFHAKSSDYISEAIKVFKAETEKHMTDKIKINRVFAEYLNRETVQRFVESGSLKDHFEKEHTLKFSKDLKINGIKFDTDSAFCDTLMRRIYSIRCSIVHSNPDFEESKAVPFSSTPANMDFLRREIMLMKEVARTIIVNSTA